MKNNYFDVRVWFVNILLLALLAIAPARAAETLTFIHTDAAGSPVAATDQNGAVLWREAYRPYGERTRNEAASTGKRQFFHGKAADPDTGLSYFGARYYDPIVGRFMGVDPQHFDEDNLHSFNRYAYGNNNPLRYRDPNGRWVEDIALAIPGIIVGSHSLATNLKAGNFSAATVDVAGLIADTAAAAMPGVPGGFGLAIAASRKGAEVAADAALAAGRSSGAAAELRVGNQVFTDVSTGGASRTLHPKVKDALDRVPQSERAPWHGQCAEPGCVSQAFNAGVNPVGGTSRAVNIGTSGKGHGTPKQTCTSCRNMLDQFGIKHD